MLRLLVLILGFVVLSALVVSSRQSPQELDQRWQAEVLSVVVATK